MPMREPSTNGAFVDPRLKVVKPAKPKRSDRWAQLNAIVDTDIHLSDSEQRVLIYLFRHADRYGKVRAGLTAIAKGCHLSRRGATKIVTRLTNKEVLAVTHRGSRDHVCNTYRIQFPRLLAGSKKP